MTLRLAIVGGGQMGEALLAGMLDAGVLAAADVAVAEPAEARRTHLADRYGVRTDADGAGLAGEAETLLLAVKPQVLDAVLGSLAPHLRPGTLVVSIAAGLTTARLESLLPPGTAVVRVMPNTPATVGEGMSVVSGGSEASAEHLARVRTLLEAVGRVIELDERFQDAATAISGSGPAYVALFIDALARAGVAQGLPRDVAQALALQTIRGTVALIEGTGRHPEQVVDGVASPGGTTIAAVEALEAGGFRHSVAVAVAAAVKRAKELGR